MPPKIIKKIGRFLLRNTDCRNCQSRSNKRLRSRCKTRGVVAPCGEVLAEWVFTYLIHFTAYRQAPAGQGFRIKTQPGLCPALERRESGQLYWLGL